MVNNQVITTHCPNTGSMHGLLKKGNKVWVTKSNNPKRKLLIDATQSIPSIQKILVRQFNLLLTSW